MTMLDEIMNRLIDMNIRGKREWDGLEEPIRMEVREQAAMASESFWTDALVAHEDAVDLPIHIAEAMTTVERDRLRAYAQIGEIIVRIARKDIDAKVARALTMIEENNEAMAWEAK